MVDKSALRILALDDEPFMLTLLSPYAGQFGIHPSTLWVTIYSLVSL